MRRSTLIPAAALVGFGLLASGCGQQLRAERDGRDLADAVCDLSEATSAEEVADAKQDIQKQLDDLARRFGATTSQDRRKIDGNLNDLAEHVAQGNQVLIQQDLAVIQRNAEQVNQDAGGIQDAAWTGFSDGLNDCLTDD